VPYNFKLNDVTDTSKKLYFSSKLQVYLTSSQVETTSRKIVSFLELSSALLALGDRCSDLTAEYVKQNYCILLGVGSGNVIRSKTGSKGIASIVVSNRAEVENYWHKHNVNEGDQLYFIIKQERVFTGKRDVEQKDIYAHAWVLEPMTSLNDPTIKDLAYEDKNGIQRLGSFIYVGRCNDRSPAQTDNITYNKPENRASRVNDSMGQKLCGTIEIFV
jgi:hypothetical protein